MPKPFDGDLPRRPNRPGRPDRPRRSFDRTDRDRAGYDDDGFDEPRRRRSPVTIALMAVVVLCSVFLGFCAFGVFVWDARNNGMGKELIERERAAAEAQAAFQARLAAPQFQPAPVPVAIAPKLLPAPAVDPLPRLVLPPIPEKVDLRSGMPLKESLTVELPGEVDLVRLGGSGRFVLLRIPSKSRVVVYDIEKRAVHRTIILTEADSPIAAGRNAIWVALPQAGVLQKYDLATGERVKSVPWPFAWPASVLSAGSDSDGPLLACEAFGDHFQRDDAPHLLDGDTLREMSFGVKAQDLSGRLLKLPTMHPRFLRASADGRTFAWTNIDMRSMAVSGNALVLSEAGSMLSSHGNRSGVSETLGPLLVANADGSSLYSSVGRVSPGLKIVPSDKRPAATLATFFPAVGGAAYVRAVDDDSIDLKDVRFDPNMKAPEERREVKEKATRPGSVEVRRESDDALLSRAEADGIHGFRVEAGKIPLVLAYDERIVAWPDLGVLMVVDERRTSFRLHPLKAVPMKK